MGTMRVVQPDEEIYEGETRRFGELQTALAKIAGCVNYRRFCETLDLTEDDFSFKQWQDFNNAVRILATEYEPEEIEDLIKVAEEIYQS